MSVPCTMHVAVGQLFAGRRPQGDDFDVEMQRRAGKRMVQVEHDIVVAYFCQKGHHPLAVAVDQLESHPRLQRYVRRERIPGDTLDGIGISKPVAVLWIDDYRFFLANGHAIERLLQAGDDVMMPLQELQWLVAYRSVNDLPFTEVEGIIEAYNQIVRYK